ncbi:hypothetical protein [Nonomuraea sp. NPDC049695]|uniref:hypothetical protein n=1 Tax=Nonomuraea sp. NPDC049695 TaxID=3154734 RepID=UPI003427EC8D
MFKRRAAVVVTAAVLGLAGMAATAGAALADDGSLKVRDDGPVKVRDEGRVKVHVGPDFRGGRLTCRLSDGKVVKFSKARVTELVDEDLIDPQLAEPATVDGVTTVPDDRLSISVPAKELPRKVTVGKRWHHKRVVHLTCVWDDRVGR